MASIINPETLSYSRALLKNSELQFVPSLLKEKQFNDTVKGLTIFVDKKNLNGTYHNIFIRDEGNILTQVSSGSSTIFAKSGFVTEDEKNLVLLDGNIQKIESNNKVSIVKFERTTLDLAGLTTKTISEKKIQETSTLELLQCIVQENISVKNCNRTEGNFKDTKIEINKRFGMPIFIPLVALVCCFLLSSRKEKKISFAYKYIHFFIGFLILIISEITVRYSGISLNHSVIYYLLPIMLLPLIYLLLIRTFKYENLNQ